MFPRTRCYCERIPLSDREYLRRGAAQEDELASTATSATAAVIHSAMATEYRRRLVDLEIERLQICPLVSAWVESLDPSVHKKELGDQ